MDKKTDNSNLESKLNLRRHLLKNHEGPMRVFDCCQGGGVIWKTLRKEFPVDRYWGTDLKPKRGRILIDSARVLEQPGWTDTVIDVDTYGEPWKHWLSILKNMGPAVTVFLTIGSTGAGGGVNMSNLQRQQIGLGSLSVPKSLFGKVMESATQIMLGQIHNFGIEAAEAAEAAEGSHARYIGVRLARIAEKASEK